MNEQNEGNGPAQKEPRGQADAPPADPSGGEPASTPGATEGADTSGGPGEDTAHEEAGERPEVEGDADRASGVREEQPEIGDLISKLLSALAETTREAVSQIERATRDLDKKIAGLTEVQGPSGSAHPSPPGPAPSEGPWQPSPAEAGGRDPGEQEEMLSVLAKAEDEARELAAEAEAEDEDGPILDDDLGGEVIDLAAERLKRKGEQQGHSELERKVGSSLKESFNRYMLEHVVDPGAEGNIEVQMDVEFLKEHGPGLLGTLFGALAEALTPETAAADHGSQEPAGDVASRKKEEEEEEDPHEGGGTRFLVRQKAADGGSIDSGHAAPPSSEPPSAEEVPSSGEVAQAEGHQVHVSMRLELGDLLKGLFQADPDPDPGPDTGPDTDPEEES